jgi:hypothetical protein
MHDDKPGGGVCPWPPEDRSNWAGKPSASLMRGTDTNPRPGAGIWKMSVKCELLHIWTPSSFGIFGIRYLCERLIEIGLGSYGGRRNR